MMQLLKLTWPLGRFNAPEIRYCSLDIDMHAFRRQAGSPCGELPDGPGYVAIAVETRGRTQSWLESGL